MATATKEKVETAPIDVKEAPAQNLPALAVAAMMEPRKLDTPVASNVYVLPQTGVAKIATAIAAVMNEIGIVEKDGRNEFHRYQYAKMEDILQRLTPLMSKHGLVIFQTELDRCMFDNDNAISVRYAFTIVSASGEVWPDRPIQTGLSRCRDSKGGFDDKALNKCHTAARKYFLLALFQIPTGSEDDADSGKSADGVKRLTKKDAGDTFKKLQAEINASDGVDSLMQWGGANAERIGLLPVDWEDTIRSKFLERKIELRNLGANDKPTGIVSEKVDAETGEVTETVEWVDEVEADAEAKRKAAKGAPGIPSLKEVQASGGDPDAIPPGLRRSVKPKEPAEPEFNEANWAEDCGKAAAAAKTIEELAAAQALHFTPHEARASAKIRKIALGAFTYRAEELSAEPEAFDGVQWLRDLDGALSGCTEAGGLADVKNKTLLAAKEKVTPEQWNTGVKAYRARVAELVPQDLTV